MPRLFVALEPTPSFRRALCLLQDRLRAAGVKGRWLDPSNLHMTLAFIGAWEKDAAEYLPSITVPFRITLAGPGIFPGAKVLWAGVKPSRELDTLAEDVRAKLDLAGVPYDKQPFYPHITLARKPYVPDSVHFSEIEVPPADMTVREVCLYKSEHLENGMVYTVIGRGGNLRK